MKTTIELPDELARTAIAHAAREHPTLRVLIERGLRLVMLGDRAQGPFTLRDASVGGRGLQPPYRDADCSRIRESIYEGRGS